MKNTERKTLVFTLLMCCSLLLLLYGPSPALFASESNCLECETIEHNHEHHEIGPINPTGEFVKGGSYADSGATGRKLECDSCRAYLD